MTKGFTLLFAVLVISIVLAVSFGIQNILVNELILSGFGRESQKAFYASFAGRECVLYWEVVHPGLSQSAFATSSASNVSCANQNFTAGGGGSNPVTNFQLSFSNGSCAKVSVTKLPNQFITIRSDGQNVPCSASQVRAVQRSLETTF